MYRVVPVAVEIVGREGDSGQFGLGYLDPFGVVAGVEMGVDLEALVVGSCPDQVDDDLMAGERPAAPVHRHGASEPVFNAIPLAGPRREVADGDV